MLGEEYWAAEGAGPGGFSRRLPGGGGLAADLETWMDLPQLGWNACPNLDQENWPCRNRAPGATAQSSMLANLKILPSLFFFFPLGLLLFFSPSFLFSSFSDDPFWQLRDSLVHPRPPSREPQTTPRSGPQRVGQNLTGHPAVQVQVGRSSKGPLPPLTQFSQMPINRCQKCWPRLRDPRLHNNPTILAVHPASINIMVFEPLGPVEFTSMLSRSLHWASA